jgi:Tol biopolymer transport system component
VLAAAVLACHREPPLPTDLSGRLIFVSDRGGRDAIYQKKLPAGAEELLLGLHEPLADPALSPDGRMLAFGMGGRIGLLDLATRGTRFLTQGVDWKDSHPAWRPDGKALVVTSRRPDSQNHDLHLLFTAAPTGGEARQALTDTPGLDEISPCFGPDGSFLVLVRAGGVYRLEPGTDRAHRLNTGFRVMRGVSFLPSGRLLAPWTEGKQFGLDLMDVEGKNRETLAQGRVSWRDASASPDGRYLAATADFEADAVGLRQQVEIKLLEARGRILGTLVQGWRSNNHSPHWAH